MSKIKVVLNRDAVRSLMQSREMQTVISQTANEIRSRCGIGYTADIIVGRNRASSRVSATTHAAKKDNLKNNTILKAMR